MFDESMGNVKLLYDLRKEHCVIFHFHCLIFGLNKMNSNLENIFRRLTGADYFELCEFSFYSDMFNVNMF